MSLWAEFLTNEGRTIHKWKHYFPAYENHFGRYVNRPMKFLEIGVGAGGSLQMWKRYFGPHAMIVGIDINPACAAIQEDQIAVRIGSQADPDFLNALVKEFGTFDVVLDDGSHIQEHIAASFAFLYPRTAQDGIYMVEDLQTAYWDQYGGGLRRAGTFIEFCKDMIDELNGDWRGPGDPPTEFTRTTQSMHFYDSICAFERGRTLAKSAPLMPPPEQQSPAAAAVTEEYIASLYATVLKRDPKPEELAYWVSIAAAMAPEQIYYSFIESKEYKLQEGSRTEN